MIGRREFLAGTLGTAALGLRPLDAGLHAMDTWFWREKELDVPAQVALLKETGYAGLALSWGQLHAERFKAARDAGLGVPGIYLTADIEGPAPRHLAEAAKLIDGSGARLWLALTSKTFKRSDPAGDAAALARIAGAVDVCGPGVTLYPHAGFWMEKVPDAVRLCASAGRPEVGLQFNLYHWMAADRGADLEGMLDAARPHLRGVSINGSGKAPSILPLSEGEYDGLPLVKGLVRIGFAGPVSHQGYGIQGRLRERLAASLAAWKRLRAAAEGDMAEPVRARAFVAGMVQGVGFRAWAESEALRRRLSGWVRNLGDGRVETLVQGPRPAVEEFLRALGRGPVSARVDRVESSWEPPAEDPEGFTIRP